MSGGAATERSPETMIRCCFDCDSAGTAARFCVCEAPFVSLDEMLNDVSQISAAVTPSEAASNPISYSGPRSIPVLQSVHFDHQRITTHGHDSDATQ